MPRAVSIVIPVYNSEPGLAKLVERIQVMMYGCADQFELVLVEDGSRDRSWDAVAALSREYPFIAAIRLMRNFGQHNALLCGIRAAKYSSIVTIDDDGQNPPEEIPALLRKLDEGYDVVYGAPETAQHDLFRTLASKATKLALSASMGAEVARSVSAFRAFRASACRAFDNFNGPNVCIDVLLTWGASRFAVVRVRHDPRGFGRSNYSFRMLVRHALNMVTGFSTAPLRVASLVGFAFTAFGGSLLVLILARYLIYGSAVPGFAFLACTITILSGAQLFTLGVMGEYLARMYSRMMERPAYVVREAIACEGFREFEIAGAASAAQCSH